MNDLNVYNILILVYVTVHSSESYWFMSHNCICCIVSLHLLYLLYINVLLVHAIYCTFDWQQCIWLSIFRSVLVLWSVFLLKGCDFLHNVIFFGGDCMHYRYNLCKKGLLCSHLSSLRLIRHISNILGGSIVSYRCWSSYRCSSASLLPFTIKPWLFLPLYFTWTMAD